MIQLNSEQIKKVVVLGGGSAGYLAAVSFAKKFPNIDLTLVYSSKMGVIGVGEGTIPSVATFLHRFLALDVVDFNRKVRPGIKLGIRYLWGPRPFFHYAFSPQCTKRHPLFHVLKGYFCEENFDFADMTAALMNFGKVSVRKPNGAPHLNETFAYHLENKTFIGYLETLADELDVKKVDGIVEGVKRSSKGVESLQLDNGQVVEGDLFIDCSGFRSELLGKSLEEPFVDFDKALFCDRAVVGGWQRTDEEYLPYTIAETMNSGWAWQIEHDEIVNRGYVYCSGFCSDDEAIDEFVSKNPKVKSPRVIQFRSGVHRRTWVQNVVAIGNSAGFVEPIEATAIGIICDGISRLVRGLKASNLRIIDLQRDIYNRIMANNWEMIRDFIAIHYRFNKRLDTPFWNMCLNDVDLGAAQGIVDYYKIAGPDLGFLSAELKSDIFTAEGYIAMLLGQKVKYQREIKMSANSLKKWDRFKNRLAEMAKNGLSMDEHVRVLRDNQPGIAPVQDLTPLVQGEGELTWH